MRDMHAAIRMKILSNFDFNWCIYVKLHLGLEKEILRGGEQSLLVYVFVCCKSQERAYAHFKLCYSLQAEQVPQFRNI